jgi:hypothetical protein
MAKSIGWSEREKERKEERNQKKRRKIIWVFKRRSIFGPSYQGTRFVQVPPFVPLSFFLSLF